MNSKQPTIKQIANALNVSVSTVSRALSDHPRIGLGTRLKVQQLAKDLGYEPNTQAIFFKQNKTFTIGVILPFIREEFFSQAICGIETIAIKNNYTILFGQSYDDLEAEKKIVDAMRKHRVDGLIVSLSKNTNDYAHFEIFKKYEIPVVYFDRVPPLNDINKVYCDLFNGTIEMVNWLHREKGCRRIALLNGTEKLMASAERLNGYKKAITGKKLKVDMRLVEVTDFSKQGTYDAMKKLLELKSPPDAIISFNDYVHMDAVQFAMKENIKVNSDIYFASYSNLAITNYTSHPPIISIEQYPQKQGEHAMDLMIKILENNKEPIEFRQVVFSAKIETTFIIH